MNQQTTASKRTDMDIAQDLSWHLRGQKVEATPPVHADDHIKLVVYPTGPGVYRELRLMKGECGTVRVYEQPGCDSRDRGVYHVVEIDALFAAKKERLTELLAPVQGMVY